MLPHKSLRRADVIASTLMIGFGVVVVWQGIRMPWASTATSGSSSSQWYLSPGLFPVITGGLLILFSLRILVTAIREGGARGIWESLGPWLSGLGGNTRIHRAVMISVLLAIYVFGALGRVNFLVASGIFLFVSIALFWWPDGVGQIWRKVLVTAVIAAGFPWVIEYLFSTFLYVPMP